MQPIQATNKLMQQSFHFIQPSEAVKNAMAYNLARRDIRAAEYLAKKHKRPTLLDKAKSYFQAVV